MTTATNSNTGLTNAQPSLLRRMNERAIFELLRRRGPISRADLTRETGISAPTVSKAIANLLEANLVEELGTAPVSGAGRPGRMYRLAQDSVQVLGAAIDVRRCCVVAAGLDGQIVDDAVSEFPTPPTYEELVGELARRSRKLMKRRAKLETLGVGISTPGEIDFKGQRVLLSPNLHMTDGRSPSRDLSERLGLEAVMFHETAGTCLHEQHFGAARGMKDFALVGVYEGFGASIVSGGRLIEGRDGLAGEVGHVTVDVDGERCGCGNHGCLETVATDIALARAVSRRVGRTMEVEEVVALAREGRIDVEEELAKTIEYLAVGIAAVINIFNPEAVFVCARMLDAQASAMERLQERVARRALGPLAANCRILRAEGDTRRGAVASIIHHLTSALGPQMG